MANSPRVTIGLPVFNGDDYLDEAIRSILSQTYTNFRLIIVDNLSNDRTGEIAKGYAREDPRIEYHLNERNIGAGPNFNRAFARSHSEYFKWAAHDDNLAPTYLEKCVTALDSDPAAVLAHSYVEEIDGAGRPIRVYEPVPKELESHHPLARFIGRVMFRGWCTEVFGVIRAEKLLGTIMMASFAGADLALITELSLRGRFIIVPEPLFLNRLHPTRYTSAVWEKAQYGVGRECLAAWHDTTNHHKHRQMHWWRFFVEYFRMINRNVEDRVERLRYYNAAVHWLTVGNNRRDLAKDLSYAISPTILRGVIQLRGRSG